MANKLTIAILGAGNIGGSLGLAWSAAGHQVTFGVRDPQGHNVQNLRQELGDKATYGTVDEALATNPNVVALAVPGAAMDDLVTRYAGQLDGRILIDTANRMGESQLNSFALLQKQTPQAKPYRVFNTLGWENFVDPLFDGVRADLFYCGPDGESRPVVEQLIADVGLRPIYMGGIENVGLVDSVAALWFELALKQHKGRHLAFKVLGY